MWKKGNRSSRCITLYRKSGQKASKRGDKKGKKAVEFFVENRERKCGKRGQLWIKNRSEKKERKEKRNRKAVCESYTQIFTHCGRIISSQVYKSAGGNVEKKGGMWYNRGMEFEKYERMLQEGEKGEKFSLFYDLLCEYNKKYNLTRITEEEDCRIKHFLDSLCGEKYFPLHARVFEVGSGAGFPSVPLMIARPDLSFVLAESVGKKCAFLEEAVRALALNARVLNARAEDTSKKAEYREKFDVCCARAVARLNTLAEYCLPFVKAGGVFIAYKGRAQEELKEAENAIKLLGGQLLRAETYELPQDAGERTLVIVKKVRPTPAAYPRGRGKERSKPL